MDFKFLTEQQQNALSAYAREVLKWGALFNLNGAANLDEFYTFHIADSISAFPIIEKYVNEHFRECDTISFADLGTGAGLPLIPLSIAFDNNPHAFEFYGIDRSLKRCTFLKNAVNVLKSQNLIKNDIKIINNDITEIPGVLGDRSQFDIITFRAFTTLSDIEKYVYRIIKPSGVLFLYKGKRSTAEGELQSLRYFKGTLRDLPRLDGHERTLMTLQPL